MSVKINEQSFSKDDILSSRANDTPDKFIQKMKQTIYKKKNNYKNILELDNIYDKSVDPENFTSIRDGSGDGSGVGSGDGASSQNKNNTKQYKESIKNNNRSDGNKKEVDDSNVVNEDFTQADEDKIYIPDYEYDFDPSSLNSTDGTMTQAESNARLGNYFDSIGVDWANINPPKKKKKNCGPDKKNCGKDGPDISKWIPYIIEKVKKILAIYPRCLNYIATYLYIFFDGLFDDAPSNNILDVQLITNILHYIIMVPVSWFFAYNWYYITFYKNIPTTAKPAEYRKTINSYIKRIAFIKSLVQVMLFLHTIIIQNVIVNSWFKVFSLFNFFYLFIIYDFFTNPMVILIIMMICFLYINCVYSDDIVKIFISFMEDKNLPFQKYLYNLVFFDIFIGVSPISIFERIIGMLKTYLNPIGSVMTFVGTIVASILLIRLSGILVIVHMYIISTFALIIFSDEHEPVQPIKEINENIYSNSNDRDACKDEINIGDEVAGILKYIINNALYILNIAIFLYSMLIIRKKMFSNSCKNIMIFFLGVFAFTCGIFMYNNSMKQSRDIDIGKLIMKREGDDEVEQK